VPRERTLAWPKVYKGSGSGEKASKNTPISKELLCGLGKAVPCEFGKILGGWQSAKSTPEIAYWYSFQENSPTSGSPHRRQVHAMELLIEWYRTRGRVRHVQK